MSVKQEPTSKHSYPYHALSAVQQSCQKMRLTWDISSHSVKVETLVNMERAIGRAIAELVANSEEQSSTINANKQDTGELPSTICCDHTSPYGGDGTMGLCNRCR